MSIFLPFLNPFMCMFIMSLLCLYYWFYITIVWYAYMLWDLIIICVFIAKQKSFYINNKKLYKYILYKLLVNLINYERYIKTLDIKYFKNNI